MRTVWKSFSDVVVANTVAETSLFGTGIGDRRLREYFWDNFQIMRLFMQGTISTAAVAPTLTFNLKLGGQTIYSPVMAATVPGLGVSPFTLEMFISARGDPQQGLLISSGTMYVGATPILNVPALATLTLPGEAAQVDLTAVWSAAAIANRIVQRTMLLEYI